MTQKILTWAPRVLAIMAILFMMLFSMDCFDEGTSLTDQLICFVMHNIPSLICIAALVVAWKWKLVGGLIFVLFFIAAGIFFKSFTGNPASLIVVSPFLICGILFILHYLLEKNRQIR